MFEISHRSFMYWRKIYKIYIHIDSSLISFRFLTFTSGKRVSSLPRLQQFVTRSLRTTHQTKMNFNHNLVAPKIAPTTTQPTPQKNAQLAAQEAAVKNEIRIQELQLEGLKSQLDSIQKRQKVHIKNQQLVLHAPTNLLHLPPPAHLVNTAAAEQSEQRAIAQYQAAQFYDIILAY